MVRLRLRKHDDMCASLCTDEAGDGCEEKHHCWCPDGVLSYAEYQAKYFVPDEPPKPGTIEFDMEYP